MKLVTEVVLAVLAFLALMDVEGAGTRFRAAAFLVAFVVCVAGLVVLVLA